MMNINLKRRLSKQSGMSLIEVMIAMTIGLIILVALGYFFIGSMNINRTTDDVSRMQESGRNALELMGRAIRQAGYRRDPTLAFGGDSKINNPNYGAKVIRGTNGASGAPDSITVRYDAQEGDDVDCTGAVVPADTSGKPSMVTATFAISGGVLTCDNGSTPANPIPIVDNIEDMQISYVIDTNATTPTSFTKDKSANSVTTSPTADEFKQVGAVQITLLTRGPTPKVATNSQTLNGVTYTDGHLRQVYSATFNVRNQSWEKDDVPTP